LWRINRQYILAGVPSQVVSPIDLVRFSAMAPEELASVGEIAAMLKVPRRNVERWVNRPDFPAPVATLSVGRIWRRADVKDWAKRTLPLKRGPAPRR
jgi:prophage regulatory protein